MNRTFKKTSFLLPLDNKNVMTDITASQKTALLKLPGFKDIQKQYAKETKMEGGGKKRMRGRGFWDDVGAWFYQAGQDINQFLKDSKIVSNVAAYALPILGAMGGALLTVNPLGATAGGIAGKSAADYIKSQGYGNQPLAINPPDQRMKGVNPKSTMRGAGKMRGKGVYDTISMFAPLAGQALSNLDSVQKKLTGKGQYTTADVDGVPTLSMLQNRKMRSIAGSGYGTNFNTMGVNGIPQVSVAPANPGMIHNISGKGMMQVRRPRNMGMGGTQYGSVSSQFGNVKF